MVGATFLVHGYQKVFQMGVDNFAPMLAQLGVPLPHVAAYLAAYAELLGGLALVLGLGVRVATLFVAFTMFVAVTKVHHGAFLAPKGMEYPLNLLVANLALFLTGAGRLSVDEWLASRATDPSAGKAAPRPCADAAAAA